MIKKSRKDPELAKSARIAYEKWYQSFKHNIDQYHEMQEFVLGNQWTQAEEDMLVTNKKVPLTANKLATLGNYLLGQQQENTPQIEVVPMTSCSQEVANIRELITKDILFSNDSAVVYQIAASQAFIGGFSAFLIENDYSHEMGWDQVIKFRWFKNPTRCYWDMGAQSISKIDGMLCGYLLPISRERFRSVYGRRVERSILGDTEIKASEEEIALAVDPNVNENPFTWADNDSICIQHHYVRKLREEMLYKLSNNETVTQDELDEIIRFSRKKANELLWSTDEAQNDLFNDEEIIDEEEESDKENISDIDEMDPDYMTLYWPETGESIRIEDKKSIKKSRIMHYEIAGDYVLDETECAASDIPLVFVDQNSYWDKKGKQICRSFFQDCVDTQKYINYLRTQSAYILKISRYDQFMGSKKNVQGADTQRIWKDPNAVQGMLIYDESPSGAKPEQLHQPELSMSLFSQYELASQDLYALTGIYPTQLGQQGNEISGEAIRARGNQGSYITKVPLTSIDRAIEAGGMIVNDMIPRVYDAERVISLMSPTEGHKKFTINKQIDSYGAHIENDIRKGTFQVRLKAGPSYQGQKQEALGSIQEILKANPTLFPLLGDLYAENLPLPNNIQLMNRLRTLVPPEVMKAGKSGETLPPKPQQPNPEQVALQMEAQFRQKEIELKERELMLKAQQEQAKLELDMMKLQNERLKAAAGIQESEFKYAAENNRTQSDEKIANADNLVRILTHKIDHHSLKGDLV